MCPARSERAERGELLFGTVDIVAHLEADAAAASTQRT